MNDAQQIVELDNDLVLERVKVGLEGYTLTLDPRAYTTRMEILLNDWPKKEDELVGNDPTGEQARDYVAGLVEAILQAKPLPLDLADPKIMLERVEQLAGEAMRSGDWASLLNWITQSKERLSVELNPGWDKETVKDRLPGNRMHRLIYFFVGLGRGTETVQSLEERRQPPPRSQAQGSAGPPANRPKATPRGRR